MNVRLYNGFGERLRLAYRIFAASPQVSPFCCYDLIDSVWRHAAHSSWLRLRRPVVMAVERGGEVVAILPLLSDISGKKFKMLADMRGVGCCDALFSPALSPMERREAAALLVEHLMKRHLSLQRIPQDSSLANALVEAGCRVKRETECCRIEIADGFEAWFRSLSKSVRQNVRTAFNRIERDGLAFSLETGSGTDFADRALALYCARQQETYINGNGLKKLYKSWAIRHSNAVTDALNHGVSAQHTVLTISNRTAACMSCFASANNNPATSPLSVIAVPRLAIDTAYRFYSPGYVMLHEFIRHHLSTSPRLTLDLGRGLEKYKTDLGATPYLTLDFRN